MDSLDQGAMGLVFDTATLDKNELRLEIKRIGGTYKGREIGTLGHATATSFRPSGASDVLKDVPQG